MWKKQHESESKYFSELVKHHGFSTSILNRLPVWGFIPGFINAGWWFGT
jgi:hypothetical protein